MPTTSLLKHRKPDSAARSLQVFGVYLYVTGLGLLLAPALVLMPLQLPVPQDMWVHMAGILALALGISDWLAGQARVPLLLRASVWRRVAASACMVALVAAALVPPAVLLLAAVDLAAAGWTAWALRRAPAAAGLRGSSVALRGAQAAAAGSAV